MKKLLFISIIILNFSNLTFAQKKVLNAKISGKVLCEGQPLPYATISIAGTTVTSITNIDGEFYISGLPAGTLSVTAKALGYKGEAQKVVTKPNSTQNVVIELEKDVLNVNEVVVSADRNLSNRAEATVVVTSISPKLLANTQSVNIAEGLCFSPGLRTECNCQNCGFTQLRMNGMEGPYTQILMNSRPVFSGLAGVYGLELIPANMVSRLEIVRGGGSALFGGNAIAGTVNIITKDPVDNTFTFDSRFAVIGVGKDEHDSDPAFDGQVNFNASIVSNDRKSGGYVYAMHRDRGAHDENGDGFSESVLMKNTTFGFNVYYKPTIKTKISFDGYKVNEFRRGGNKLDYLPHETDITEQLLHNIVGANLAFDYFTNSKYDKLTSFVALQQVDRDSYYGTQKDPLAYGKTHDLSLSFGSQYVLNASHFLFAPSSTVFGIENNLNKLDDHKLGVGGVDNFELSNQMVNTTGGFVQHDWKSDKLNASVGLRFDHYLVRDLKTDGTEVDDVTGNVFLPRVSLMYKVFPKIRVRVGYAQGYRAPQVFNEDLHIDLIGANRIERENDKDLVQETSHAITASINAEFNTGSLVNSLLIEGFYTKLENPFTDEYEEIPGSAGSFKYVRINAADGAYVAGTNIEYQTFFSNALETSLGFTLQKSEFVKAQAWGDDATSTSKKFMRTPDFYGYFTANWNATKAFKTTVSLNYTGSMYVPHFGPKRSEANADQLAAIARGDIIEGEILEKSEEFLIVDLLFNYTFKLSRDIKLQLYAGVKNVFNQTQEKHDSGEYRDAGYIYGPCQPRTVNVGLKIGNVF